VNPDDRPFQYNTSANTARERICIVASQFTGCSEMPGPSRTFTFLGTGTSVGVPMLGCTCAVCRSTDPHNHRYRCSVLIRCAEGNLVIDTSPELRLQLLREQVDMVHAVLYTHYHADHLFGLDDLRPLSWRLGASIPLYCTAETEEKVRDAFGYAFKKPADMFAPGAIPKLRFVRITEEPFSVLGQEVTPIPLLHAHFNVFGFRIDDVAYCTDVNLIPEASWPMLQGLRVLVLDALRHKPHPAHFSLNEALDVIERLKPEQAYLTHMGHDIDHEAVSRELPRGVALAYDGLSFSF
jgi:phosphoribosyl 1,2-cyclic phosphate phosphodiesterase